VYRDYLGSASPAKDDKLSRIDVIQVIDGERRQMRDEQIALQSTFYKTLMGFFSLATVALTIGWSDNLIGNPNLRAVLLFLLSQTEFAIAVGLLVIMALMSVHGGYIASLEKALNRIARLDICMWESDIVQRHIIRPTGVLFWNGIALTGILAAAYVGLQIGAALAIGRTVVWAIVAGEFAVFALLSVATLLEPDRVTRYAWGRLSEDLTIYEEVPSLIGSEGSCSDSDDPELTSGSANPS